MDDHEFRKKLDAISPSFCLAKWYNATIWLGSGMTTSCHHPPAHKIPDEVRENPALLHNTPEKQMDRAMMLKGERPEGCDYCWKVQDMGTNAVPDRVYKSNIYNDADFASATARINADKMVPLRTLEISFDRTCNFACSYCNPAFSTTWVKDIKKHGPYTDISPESAGHFSHTHDGAQLYSYKDTDQNPYIEAFWKWWDSHLKYSLEELRITGGEPTMSPHFWELLKKMADIAVVRRDDGGLTIRTTMPRLAFNSNLGIDVHDRARLIDFSHRMEIDLYTSCESFGKEAEYIRDGLDYNKWSMNFVAMINNGNFRRASVMSTINALCLWSLPIFLENYMYSRDAMHRIKPDTELPSFTLNILRFPAFQSCLVLPLDMRKRLSAPLQNLLWKTDHKRFHAHEIDQIGRLIDYLHEPEPENVERRRQDFKNFYTQYDKRREKNIRETFPEEFVEWYDSI